MPGQVQRFTYPESTELRDIEQDKLPRSLDLSPIFRYFPQIGADNHLLEWEQQDTYGGMTQLRGLDGEPPRVANVGSRKFIFQPGIYGEHMTIDEAEMTKRARRNNNQVRIPIDDLVVRRQDMLLTRRLNRIEWLCWMLFLQGHFIAHDVNGVILHRGAYAIQRHVAPTVWSDRANARPLEDLTTVKLMGRGYNADFGPRARALMNSITAAHATRNTNQADFGGKRGNNGQSLTGLNDANVIITGEGLPNIEVYDGGYRDSSGTWTPYIPDGKVAVAGVLPEGESIGEFRFTTNINASEIGAPEPYVKVIDKQDKVPRVIEVHDGFNGGPVIFYPGAVVIMDVL
jgi:hypothetical protein